ESENWTVRDDIRRMVAFRQANLLSPPGGLGRFDVIFCRNVLMYLDAAARVRVLQNLHAATRPDSVLFLGVAESVSGLTELFVPFDGYPGLFLRRDGAFPQSTAL